MQGWENYPIRGYLMIFSLPFSPPLAGPLPLREKEYQTKRVMKNALFLQIHLARDAVSHLNGSRGPGRPLAYVMV